MLLSCTPFCEVLKSYKECFEKLLFGDWITAAGFIGKFFHSKSLSMDCVSVTVRHLPDIVNFNPVRL
jgi:hypothetical protein